MFHPISRRVVLVASACFVTAASMPACARAQGKEIPFKRFDGIGNSPANGQSAGARVYKTEAEFLEDFGKEVGFRNGQPLWDLMDPDGKVLFDFKATSLIVVPATRVDPKGRGQVRVEVLSVERDGHAVTVRFIQRVGDAETGISAAGWQQIGAVVGIARPDADDTFTFKDVGQPAAAPFSEVTLETQLIPRRVGTPGFRSNAMQPLITIDSTGRAMVWETALDMKTDSRYSTAPGDDSTTIEDASATRRLFEAYVSKDRMSQLERAWAGTNALGSEFTESLTDYATGTITSGRADVTTKRAISASIGQGLKEVAVTDDPAVRALGSLMESIRDEILARKATLGDSQGTPETLKGPFQLLYTDGPALMVSLDPNTTGDFCSLALPPDVDAAELDGHHVIARGYLEKKVTGIESGANFGHWTMRVTRIVQDPAFAELDEKLAALHDELDEIQKHENRVLKKQYRIGDLITGLEDSYRDLIDRRRERLTKRLTREGVPESEVADRIAADPRLQRLQRALDEDPDLKVLRAAADRQAMADAPQLAALQRRFDRVMKEQAEIGGKLGPLSGSSSVPGFVKALDKR
jgi:hypothetical protein